MLKNIRLDDLTLDTKLGNGAFGEVFKSKISGSDTIYATKRLEKRKFMKNPKAYKTANANDFTEVSTSTKPYTFENLTSGTEYKINRKLSREPSP